MLCNREARSANGHAEGKVHKQMLGWWHALTPEVQLQATRGWGTEHVFLGQPSPPPTAQQTQQERLLQAVITTPSDTVIITRPTHNPEVTSIGFEVPLAQASNIAEQLMALVEASRGNHTNAIPLTNGDVHTDAGLSASASRLGCEVRSWM